jgi:hypothetical protein
LPDRNPYLIIGVDFGASRDEARHAFARAARRTRREGGTWTIEDLNWALHEIDALEQNPADLVGLYRVPADPSVFEPAGVGLFKPTPVALERQTAADEQAVSELKDGAIDELDGLLVAAIGSFDVKADLGYGVEGAQQ